MNAVNLNPCARRCAPMAESSAIHLVVEEECDDRGNCVDYVTIAVAGKKIELTCGWGVEMTWVTTSRDEKVFRSLDELRKYIREKTLCDDDAVARKVEELLNA